MSDLRYFADMMHEAIERDTRAKRYKNRCEQERDRAVKAMGRADEIPEAFHKANEGLCAVRIIMGETIDAVY